MSRMFDYCEAPRRRPEYASRRKYPIAGAMTGFEFPSGQIAGRCRRLTVSQECPVRHGFISVELFEKDDAFARSS